MASLWSAMLPCLPSIKSVRLRSDQRLSRNTWTSKMSLPGPPLKCFWTHPGDAKKGSDLIEGDEWEREDDTESSSIAFPLSPTVVVQAHHPEASGVGPRHHP